MSRYMYRYDTPTTFTPLASQSQYTWLGEIKATKGQSINVCKLLYLFVGAYKIQNIALEDTMGRYCKRSMSAL